MTRVTDYARPREVLVTVDVVGLCANDKLRFDSSGAVTLRGLPEPVDLFRAAR